MTGSDSEQCHICDEDANLAASDSDGVFRPICRSCFARSHRKSHLKGLTDKLEDWRWLFFGGLLLVWVAIAMQFKTVPQAVQLPAWFYGTFGTVCVALGIREFRGVVR